MEPPMTVAVDSAPTSRCLTLGRVLAETWSAWVNNALPLLGSVLLLQVPVALLDLLPGGTSKAAAAGQGLLYSVVDMIVSLAQLGAVTLAGLRALRGEPLRVAGLARDGLKRAWLLFKVGFLSWWAVLVVLVVLFFLARANFPVLATAPAGWDAQFWFLMALQGFGSVAVMVWYYPAVPLALSRPELGARKAVRRARELTRGARARLLAVALAFECLSAPFWVPYRWASTLSPGGGKTLATIALGALTALIASFQHLGRVNVDRALRYEREGAAADLYGLERVFE